MPILPFNTCHEYKRGLSISFLHYHIHFQISSLVNVLTALFSFVANFDTFRLSRCDVKLNSMCLSSVFGIEHAANLTLDVAKRNYSAQTAACMSLAEDKFLNTASLQYYCIRRIATFFGTPPPSQTLLTTGSTGYFVSKLAVGSSFFSECDPHI